MGVFSNNSITDKGRLLLADVQAGAVFVPTRIVIGAGNLPSTVTTQTITDVIAPIKSLEINKKKRSNDGKCTFGGVYTNEDITEDFYFRELALYAKAVYLNEDGTAKSEGAEVLYSYGNSGNTADLMPAYSASTVVERQIDLVVWVGNNVQIALTVESGIYVTHEDFDSHAARHSTGGEDEITPESIGAVRAFGRYGGGGMEALDALTSTGNYSWLCPADNPFGAAEGALFVVAVDCPNYGGNPVVTQDITQVYAAGGSLPLGASFHRTIFDTWKSGWNKRYDTANLPNPEDIGALRLLTTKPHGIGFDHNTAELYFNIDGINYNIPIGWGRYEVAPAGYGYGGESIYVGDGSESVLEGVFSGIIATMKNYSTKQIAFTCNDGTLQGKGVFTAVICKAEPKFAHIYASTYNHNMAVKKSLFDGVWQPWEWDNPPMRVDVEYRLTERWNGSPVYVKMINCGTMPDKTYTQVSNVLPSGAKVISMSGFCRKTGFTSVVAIPSRYCHVGYEADWNGLFISTDDDFSPFTGFVTIKYLKD